jgi:transcriptional regulator with XRE-family HTH domain
MARSLNFGERLLRLRKTLGKSQMQVAEEIEALFPNAIRMSQTTLSALEQRDSAPREDVIDVLCKYYNVPITYFFVDVDTGDRPFDVKSYIEALRLYTPDSVQRFAHTRGKRYEHDDVSQDLDNLTDADAGMLTD